MKLSLLILAVLCLCALPTDSQQPAATPSKEACKDVILEKEIADFTRILETDNDRLKLGILTEDITWKDEYRRAVIDIIQSDFPTKFVAAPDQRMSVPIVYINGTSVVSNGAQFVNVRIELFPSDDMVIPENAKTFMDYHVAKIGDPTRLVKGELVLAEHGVLLAPIEGGMNFELWHQLNLQKVRENIKRTLSDFAAKWDEAAKK
jgi:hypothetical protein